MSEVPLPNSSPRYCPTPTHQIPGSASPPPQMHHHMQSQSMGNYYSYHNSQSAPTQQNYYSSAQATPNPGYYGAMNPHQQQNQYVQQAPQWQQQQQHVHNPGYYSHSYAPPQQNYTSHSPQHSPHTHPQQIAVTGSVSPSIGQYDMSLTQMGPSNHTLTQNHQHVVTNSDSGGQQSSIMNLARFVNNNNQNTTMQQNLGVNNNMIMSGESVSPRPEPRNSPIVVPPPPSIIPALSSSTVLLSSSSISTPAPVPIATGSTNIIPNATNGNGGQTGGMMPVRLQNMAKGARTKASMRKLLLEQQSTANSNSVEVPSENSSEEPPKKRARRRRKSSEPSEKVCSEQSSSTTTAVPEAKPKQTPKRKAPQSKVDKEEKPAPVALPSQSSKPSKSQKSPKSPAKSTTNEPTPTDKIVKLLDMDNPSTNTCSAVNDETIVAPAPKRAQRSRKASAAATDGSSTVQSPPEPRKFEEEIAFVLLDLKTGKGSPEKEKGKAGKQQEDSASKSEQIGQQTAGKNRKRKPSTKTADMPIVEPRETTPSRGRTKKGEKRKSLQSPDITSNVRGGKVTAAAKGKSGKISSPDDLTSNIIPEISSTPKPSKAKKKPNVPKSEITTASLTSNLIKSQAGTSSSIAHHVTTSEEFPVLSIPEGASSGTIIVEMTSMTLEPTIKKSKRSYARKSPGRKVQEDVVVPPPPPASKAPKKSKKTSPSRVRGKKGEKQNAHSLHTTAMSEGTLPAENETPTNKKKYGKKAVTDHANTSHDNTLTELGAQSTTKATPKRSKSKGKSDSMPKSEATSTPITTNLGKSPATIASSLEQNIATSVEFPVLSIPEDASSSTIIVEMTAAALQPATKKSKRPYAKKTPAKKATNEVNPLLLPVSKSPPPKQGKKLTQSKKKGKKGEKSLLPLDVINHSVSPIDYVSHNKDVPTAAPSKRKNSKKSLSNDLISNINADISVTPPTPIRSKAKKKSISKSEGITPSTLVQSQVEIPSNVEHNAATPVEFPVLSIPEDAASGTMSLEMTSVTSEPTTKKSKRSYVKKTRAGKVQDDETVAPPVTGTPSVSKSPPPKNSKKPPQSKGKSKKGEPQSFSSYIDNFASNTNDQSLPEGVQEASTTKRKYVKKSAIADLNISNDKKNIPEQVVTLSTTPLTLKRSKSKAKSGTVPKSESATISPSTTNFVNAGLQSSMELCVPTSEEFPVLSIPEDASSATIIVEMASTATPSAKKPKRSYAKKTPVNKPVNEEVTPLPPVAKSLKKSKSKKLKQENDNSLLAKQDIFNASPKDNRESLGSTSTKAGVYINRPSVGTSLKKRLSRIAKEETERRENETIMEVSLACEEPLPPLSHYLKNEYSLRNNYPPSIPSSQKRKAARLLLEAQKHMRGVAAASTEPVKIPTPLPSSKTNLEAHSMLEARKNHLMAQLYPFDGSTPSSSAQPSTPSTSSTTKKRKDAHRLLEARKNVIMAELDSTVTSSSTPTPPSAKNRIESHRLLEVRKNEIMAELNQLQPHTINQSKPFVKEPKQPKSRKSSSLPNAEICPSSTITFIPALAEPLKPPSVFVKSAPLAEPLSQSSQSSTKPDTGKGGNKKSKKGDKPTEGKGKGQKNLRKAGPNVRVKNGAVKFYRGSDEEDIDVPLSKLRLERPSEAFDSSVPWTCTFCRLGPHAQRLGDLFGPYYVKTPTGANGRSQKETWMHQDCALWAGGVILIGVTVRGLDEAVHNANSTSCTICHAKGATIGCLSRKCPQAAHFPCAQKSMWKLDDETFHSYCQQHQKYYVYFHVRLRCW